MTITLQANMGSYAHEWTDGMGQRWRMTDVGIQRIDSTPPTSFTALQNLTNPIRVPVCLNPRSKPYARKKAAREDADE